MGPFDWYLSGFSNCRIAWVEPWTAPGWASFDPHAWVGLLDSASPLNRNRLGARSGRGVPYRTISNLRGELSKIY